MVKGIRTVVQRPERVLSLQNVRVRAKVASRLLYFVQILLFFDSFLDQNPAIFGEKRMLFSRTIGCCVAQHIEIFAYSEKCPYLCGTLKT